MKKRKGRSIDHTWRFVQYKGDLAIYAKCSCGFRYACQRPDGNMFKTVAAPEKLYYYCPICGARKTKYIEEIIKIDHSWWEEIFK